MYILLFILYILLHSSKAMAATAACVTLDLAGSQTVSHGCVSQPDSLLAGPRANAMILVNTTHVMTTSLAVALVTKLRPNFGGI